MTLRPRKVQRLREEWEDGVSIREIARDLRVAPSTVFRYVLQFKEEERLMREIEEERRRREQARIREERLRKQRELREERKRRERETATLKRLIAGRREREIIVDEMMKRDDYLQIMAHRFIREFPAYFLSYEVQTHHELEESFPAFLKLLKENKDLNSDFREFCIQNTDPEKIKEWPNCWRTLRIGTFAYETAVYELAAQFANIKKEDYLKQQIDQFKFQLLHPEMFRIVERQLFF